MRCIGWDTEVVTEDCMVSERCLEPATEAVRDTDLWFCARHMRLATDVYGWARDHAPAAAADATDSQETAAPRPRE